MKNLLRILTIGLLIAPALAGAAFVAGMSLSALALGFLRLIGVL